ncbi:hypothetical protein UT300012_31840 [Paraclostridium bifermentans]
MKTMINEKEKNLLDGVIDSVDLFLENMGFEHIKMSESNSISTTAYEGIVFRNGNTEYTISFDVSKSYNRENDVYENTKHIDKTLNR